MEEIIQEPVRIYTDFVKEAFESHDLTRLQNLAEKVASSEPSTDKYFWYYLSLDGDLFYPIYSEHQQKNSGNFLNSIEQLVQPIELVEVDEYNCGAQSMLTNGRTRTMASQHYYSADDNEAQRCLGEFLQDDRLINFIHEIIRNPNIVIAGGLPAACIYQHFTFGQNGTRVLSRPSDIDIFFIKPETSEDDFLSIVASAVRLLGTKVLINLNNLVYTIYHKYGTKTAKIQMIGRKYSDLNQIALAFDLDSSCAFYYLGNFYYHQRFWRAVHFGHNLINPYRKSKSYLYRLKKYLDRGFTVHIPGNIQKYRKAIGAREICNQVLNSTLQEKVSDYENASIEATSMLEAYEELPEFSNEYLEAHRNDLYGIIVLTYTTGVKGYKINSLNTFSTCSWLSIEPGTQIAGSFNPITIDILKYGLLRTPEIIAEIQNKINEVQET